MARHHGDGSIDTRGEAHRLRYRVNGKRFTKTVHGTLQDARKELRRLLKAGDDGDHVDPSKVTVGEWINHWIEIGCPAGKKKTKSRRQKTVARYGELLRHHVVPTLGNVSLQKLQGADIDTLYVALGHKLAPRTAHHIHTVLGSCLGAAVRTRRISRDPMLELMQAPSPGESNHGMRLDADQLQTLMHGFVGTTLHEIVAVACMTGMRRGEILALRWSDIDWVEKTFTVERALEYTRKAGLAFKSPKTERGRRTFVVDESLLDLLQRLQQKYLQIIAGVPDGTHIDLSLVKLPPESLVFPAPDGELAAPRHPDAVTKQFTNRAAKLGFPGLRFHDIRGSHECAALNAGTPLHIVAARAGHDVGTMLRNYTQLTEQADADAAKRLGKIMKAVL
jgi:hypothetical protein